MDHDEDEDVDIDIEVGPAHIRMHIPKAVVATVLTLLGAALAKYLSS